MEQGSRTWGLEDVRGSPVLGLELPPVFPSPDFTDLSPTSGLANMAFSKQ